MKVFTIKALFKLLFIKTFLLQVAICQASPKEPAELPQSAEKFVEVDCVVDSSVYNRPLVKGPGDHVPVPLQDGAKITVVKSSTQIRKIEISPGPEFRRCAEKIHVISDTNKAKSFLEFTQIENTDVFLGAELAFCNTIDEGWFFILGKRTAFVGYAGPMEKPIAFVGMTCD